MWWWAPTNAHHCAIQPTITLTTFLYCILQCTNNATSSCSKAINQFSIITQKFPGGPFKFQEISRISRRVLKFQEISRSCRHPGLSKTLIVKKSDGYWLFKIIGNWDTWWWNFLGEQAYSKLDRVKTMGTRRKINAIWWNIMINLQKLTGIGTSSSAVAGRPCDTSCPSVISFKSVIPRAQSFIIVTCPNHASRRFLIFWTSDSSCCILSSSSSS